MLDNPIVEAVVMVALGVTVILAFSFVGNRVSRMSRSLKPKTPMEEVLERLGRLEKSQRELKETVASRKRWLEDIIEKVDEGDRHLSGRISHIEEMLASFHSATEHFLEGL